jgi:hypothetical protein
VCHVTYSEDNCWLASLAALYRFKLPHRKLRKLPLIHLIATIQASCLSAEVVEAVALPLVQTVVVSTIETT